MALRIAVSAEEGRAGAAEFARIGELSARHARVTVLVTDFAERERVRRALAEAGVCLGVAVETPRTWICELAELFGDGRSAVSSVERSMAMAGVLEDAPADELAPLRRNPGTIRLLSRMAAELSAYVDAAECEGPAGKVMSLLAACECRLERAGLIEPARIARRAARAGAGTQMLGCVVVAGPVPMPAYLRELIETVARTGDVEFLLDAASSGFAQDLAAAFSAAGAAVCLDLPPRGPAPSAMPCPRLVEAAGPHSVRRSAVLELTRLLRPDAEPVALVSPHVTESFFTLAPALAAHGVSLRARLVLPFERTEVGRQLERLLDLSARMSSADGPLESSTWWPAPELSDWLASPLSGTRVADVRRFDKSIRGKRSLSPDDVMRALQSIQGACNRARTDGEPPCVASDVFSFICQGRPVSALKSMRSAALALPDAAWGPAGAVRASLELAAIDAALAALVDTARRLRVSQTSALAALSSVRVSAGARAEANSQVAYRGEVDLMDARSAAALAEGSVSAVVFEDVDVSSYSIAADAGVQDALSRQVGSPRVEASPASIQRRDFLSALSLVPHDVRVLMRCAHDGQAKDRFPAAIWVQFTAGMGKDELKSLVEVVDESEIELDIDPALRRDDAAHAAHAGERVVSCLPPQALSPRALPYLVPMRRDADGALVPRQLSASQIETYASCPLCWFISSRVRPQRLDAGFGPIEFGNFVHDVMYRLHARLIDEGMRRVTPENVDVACEMLGDVFAEVRAEHARGKTDSSAPLIPHSATEAAQIDRILPQIVSALRYEAGALSAFYPEFLEYSFNGLGVSYAGWPLGGRIDRADVDAEGHVVVIDYKHRSQVDEFKLADPTIPDKRTGAVVADDPRWLPRHTQSLIYAQALRRSDRLAAERGGALEPVGALYFSTKGRAPAMRGAVAAQLTEEEPGDGRVPGLKSGFPGEEGGMGFDELLDRVEEQIACRLSELAAGAVHQVGARARSCDYNHAPDSFRRRSA